MGWAGIVAYVLMGLFAIQIFFSVGIQAIAAAALIWPVTLILTVLGAFVGGPAGAILGFGAASVFGWWYYERFIY